MSNVIVVYLNSMFNVLLQETKYAIHRHKETSEVVCIYGSAIERLYDEQGNEMVVLKADRGVDEKAHR